MNQEKELAIQEKSIQRIEAFDLAIGAKVDVLLEGQATRTEAISNLRAVVDRIEKKIDEHMSKGK
jgi:hypothetical protein